MSTTILSTEQNRLATLSERYQAVRSFSVEICKPLQTEDYVIQTMPDVSPTRWHLAHTTWFFETFALKPYRKDFRSPNDQFEFLFNSYYNAVGQQFPRPERGHLSRPTVREVMQYRADIDEQMSELLRNLSPDGANTLLDVVELGLHHEQQHQELMLTDIKHVFSRNPLFPKYDASTSGRPMGNDDEGIPRSDTDWIPGESGILFLGDDSRAFAFDNERPRHQVLVSPHTLSARLVTCGEYRQFIDDGGYRQPEWWLSLGWQVVQQQGWHAPLYWHAIDGDWHQFTLQGLQPIDDHEPVCHVSFFEADAYARWRGHRLPTEVEWESMASALPVEGNFAEHRRFHPIRAIGGAIPRQMYGDVWEWTASPYTPYPGFRPATGALGEYNGKFMCNQFVLRGGSCATSQSHIRATYRNFFPPEARWQFTGIRLATDEP